MAHPFRFIYAALVAALLGLAGLTPAGAASIPTGAALTLDQASARADDAQWRGRGGHRARHSFHARPVYRGRPAYHGRPVYRHRPVYRRHFYQPNYYYNPYPVYRPCVMRKRLVWTRHGYVRRWVRVCR